MSDSEDEEIYHFYVVGSNGNTLSFNEKDVNLYIDYERKYLDNAFGIIAREAYFEMWNTMAVGEPYTGIQIIFCENNIGFEDNFTISILSEDKVLLGKAKISYPDSVEIIISCNELRGGGV